MSPLLELSRARPHAETTATHMADATGGAVSAPGDPDTESDDGGELDLLDLPLPTLFARGAAIHRAAQEGTIPQVRTSGRHCAVAVRPRGALKRRPVS